MKTIKDFLNDIETNEQLKISLENIKSVEEMCKEARKFGYDFSENELVEYYLDAVSGGFGDVDKSSYTGTLTQKIKGEQNIQVNYGNVIASGGDVSQNSSAQLTADQKFQLVMGLLNRRIWV